MRSKFKTFPGSNIWKKKRKKSGITYNSPLKIAHVTDWVANWLGRDASGGIGGGSLSIFLLLLHPSLFFYLSGWVEFIICCEGAAHDKHASGRAGAAISLGMNERPHFDPTRGGKHMFCWSWLAGYLQRGLGIPPAGGMRRWRDRRRRKSCRSPCVCGALTLTWRGCWHIVLLSDMTGVLLKGLNNLRCMKVWSGFGWSGIRGRVTKRVTWMEGCCIILYVVVHWTC